MKRTVLLLIAASCSGNSVNKLDTWGEVVSAFSEAACGASITCGFGSQEQADACTDHSVFHLCELPGNCDEKVSEVDLSFCLSDLENLDENGCVWLRFYGLTPESCQVVWDVQPEDER